MINLIMIKQKLQQSIVTAFGRRPEILAAYVLGSVVSGKAVKESDFDLAVVVDNKKNLSFEKIYDLISSISFPRNLDLSVVDKSSSPLFLFQMISKGKKIYIRDHQEIVAFEAFVLHNYYDTQHMRNIYYSYLKEKFKDKNYAYR